MGYALAEAARDRGAAVTLISGPVELPALPGVPLVRVVSADELAQAVDRHLDGARVLVMAAAVSDQRPKSRALHKMKKQPGEETLTLVRTPDILAGVAARAHRPLLVGFAAESENVEENAREKLQRKDLDLIVANDVADAFGKETNRVLVLGKDGARSELSGSKLSLAHAIWNMVRERLSGYTARMREVIGELRAWLAWAQESGLSNLAQAAAAPPPQAQEAPLKLHLLDPVREELGECTRCKLHKGRNNIVFGVGNPRARLMFVGEAPGEDEDIAGLPLRRQGRPAPHQDDRGDGPARATTSTSATP